MMGFTGDSPGPTSRTERETWGTPTLVSSVQCFRDLTAGDHLDDSG